MRYCDFIRQHFGRKPSPPKPAAPKCLACGRRAPDRNRHGNVHSHGMCRTCARAKKEAEIEHEPTEAELDAMIAEQMKCLPSWWA